MFLRKRFGSLEPGVCIVGKPDAAIELADQIGHIRNMLRSNDTGVDGSTKEHDRLDAVNPLFLRPSIRSADISGGQMQIGDRIEWISFPAGNPDRMFEFPPKRCSLVLT